MDQILTSRGGKLREFLRKAIAEHDRTPDQTRKQLEMKRKNNATFQMIDGYRSEFKLAQASRGAFNVESKKIVAHFDCFVMHAGPEWEPIDSVDLVGRQRTAHQAYTRAEESMSTRQKFRNHMRARLKELSGIKVARSPEVTFTKGRKWANGNFARAAAEWTSRRAAAVASLVTHRSPTSRSPASGLRSHACPA